MGFEYDILSSVLNLFGCVKTLDLQNLDCDTCEVSVMTLKNSNKIRRSNETMSVYRPAQDWSHTNYINCIYARSGALIE